MTRMTLGSLFDGSGGFPLAGLMHGIEPRWLAEIEPYPCRVTAKRFPDIPNHGDVTKISGAEIEPVDIITFGSLCQDLSVAGKQAGIHEGTRSSLFFEAIRIIREMREHDRAAGRTGVDIRPRFAVWENVPGAFSSHGGKDFHAVLQALAEVKEPGVLVPEYGGRWKPAGCIVGNGWSIAWRVYDAQYWGVPQRRKRIYLIADFGTERAGEILFESEGVSGDPAESGEAWEGTAADAEGGAGRSNYACGGVIPWEEALNIWQTDPECYAIDHVVTTGGNCTVQGPCYYENICPTEKASGAHAVCYPNIARSLIARADSGPCVDRGQNFVVYDARGNGEGGVSPTITGDHQNRVTDYTAIIVEAGHE